MLDFLQVLQSNSNAFTLQTLIQDLEALSFNCRSNSCIEHATGIMEDESAPERLSKGVSTISLGDDKRKVCFVQVLVHLNV